MAVEKRRYMDVMLGLFVAIGIALLATLIFLIGKERRVFDTSSHVHAYFSNVAGLAVGADVMLAGVTVGHVSDVVIPTLKMNNTSPDRRIRVVMRVSRDVMPWLRKDSVARIDSKGLLGDKTINISLGTPDFPALKDGGVLKSETPLDINDALAKAQVILNNVTETTIGIRKVIDGFQDQGGIDAVADAVRSLKNITAEVEKGHGIVHKLVYDERAGNDFAESLSGLNQAIGSIKDAAASVQALMAGVTPGQGREVIKLAQSILDDVNAVSKEVRNGSGLLHSLVYDSSNNNMIASLNEAAANINSMVASVKAGQGTVGRLINDSSIYDDLKQILGRVKRNEALKALVRYSISK